MAPIASAADLWAQLDAFASKMEPPIAKAFRDAILHVRASLSQEALDEVVRSGDVRPIIEQLDLTNFKLALRRSLIDSANRVVDNPFTVNFDVLNPIAIRAIQTAEFALTHKLTQEVAEGVRWYLAQGLKTGVNPVETAREIRDIIGLTRSGAQSVLNYRRLLTGGAQGQPYMEALRRASRDGRFDQSVLRAIQDRTPLKPNQVERQVQRFEERAIKQRAEMISRTESMNALHQGQHVRWRQAIDAGNVDEGDLRRFWHTAKDERVCPICAAVPALNPEGVAFEQPFQMIEGEPIMGPTAHPNCRCVVFIRVVFAKRVPLYDLRQLARELSGFSRRN